MNTTATPQAIENAILEALRQRCGPAVRLDSPFAQLGLDSLSMAELSFELETRLGLRLDEQVLDVATVRELVELVQRMRK